jgi:hypothetical protein
LHAYSAASSFSLEAIAFTAFEQETAIQICYLSRTKLQEKIPFATVSVSV